MIVSAEPIEVHLEVPRGEEAGGADPAGGQAGRVQHAVLVALDDQGVAQQANQHHCRDTHRHSTDAQRSVPHGHGHTKNTVCSSRCCGAHSTRPCCGTPYKVFLCVSEIDVGL